MDREIPQRRRGMIDFSDLCDPETISEIHENIIFYSKPETYSEKALNVFRELAKESERKCGVVIRSMFEYPKTPKQEKLITLIGFQEVEICPKGRTKFVDPKPEEKPRIQDPEPDARILALRSLQRAFPPPIYTEEYPEICDKTCPRTQCSSWGNPNAMGKPCRNIVPTTEQIKSEYIKPKNPNEELLRTLDPNEPDYHSPAYSSEEPLPFKAKQYKESLNPL